MPRLPATSPLHPTPIRKPDRRSSLSPRSATKPRSPPMGPDQLSSSPTGSPPIVAASSAISTPSVASVASSASSCSVLGAADVDSATSPPASPPYAVSRIPIRRHPHGSVAQLILESGEPFGPELGLGRRGSVPYGSASGSISASGSGSGSGSASASSPLTLAASSIDSSSSVRLPSVFTPPETNTLVQLSQKPQLTTPSRKKHSSPSSRRRSSFLSECMLKERAVFRPTGYDADGWESFSVQLTESQGFRWNNTLYEIADDAGFEEVFD